MRGPRHSAGRAGFGAGLAGRGRALAGAVVAVVGVSLGIGALLLIDPGHDRPAAVAPTRAAPAGPTAPGPAPTATAGPAGSTARPSPQPVVAGPPKLSPPKLSPPKLSPPTVGAPAPRPGPPAPAPMLAVTVLNNSRFTGLAWRAAARYRTAGWPVATIGNFTGRLRATTVYYAPGQQPSAVRFARQFGVARVLPRFAGLPGCGLTVVLTRDAV